MGLLDPVYAGVNSVIAGAGSVAGGAVSSGTTPHIFHHHFFSLSIGLLRFRELSLGHG